MAKYPNSVKAATARQPRSTSSHGKTGSTASTRGAPSPPADSQGHHRMAGSPSAAWPGESLGSA